VNKLLSFGDEKEMFSTSIILEEFSSVEMKFLKEE